MTADDIIQIAADHFQISREDLLCRRRLGHMIFPRHCTMTAIRCNLNLPLKHIAGLFGRSSHKTVLHAIENAAKQCETYPAFERFLAGISPQDSW